MATGNSTSLGTTAAAYKARSGAPAAPADAIEGKAGSATFTGNASLTAFDVTHALGKAPSQVLITPSTAVASALHAVTTKDATKFTVTYAAAPAAGANNIKFDWLAI